MEQQQEHSLFDMEMDTNAQSVMLTVSKWSSFIALTGFIIGALVLVLAAAYGPQIIQAFTTMLSINSRGQEAAGILIGVMVIVIALVVAWLYFLYRSANLLKRGLESRNTNLLAEGFRAMRIYFTLSFVMSVMSIFSTLSEMF